MALPGQRGFGRNQGSSFGARKKGAGNVSSGVGNAITGSITGSRDMPFQQPPRSPGIRQPSSLDPAAGRRIESLEQRVNGHDQANRTLLEQIMKLTQDMKMEIKKNESAIMFEKNERLRLETAVTSATTKQFDIEERLKRTEEAARDNKTALSQLISHTKNVERAVTMSQQDILTKKETQVQKLQDLQAKISALNTSKDTLERMCHNSRDEIQDIISKLENISLEVKDVQGEQRVQSKMLSTRENQIRGVEEQETAKGKLTETQKAALDARILQLQQLVVDVQSKLNHEQKDREVDQKDLSARISDLTSEVAETRRKRDTDLRELANTTRELANMSDAEKQRIIVQISAVQTELKRTMDERDVKLRQSTVHRLEEVEQQLKLESKQRVENEKDSRLATESLENKVKLYTDESTDTVRQMVSVEQDTIRTRIKELSDLCNELELQIAEIKGESAAMVTHNANDQKAKEEILEAKIDDLSDRLRLGMAKMQAAVGETSAAASGRMITLEEAEQLREDDLEGIREHTTRQISGLEEKVVSLQLESERQDGIIENKLRSHQHAGTEQSNILGDKLQQKMDSITFTQERMKRQLDDLEGKTSGAPNDISDINQRFHDLERQNDRKTKDKTSHEDRIEGLEKDMDHIMGRSETSNVSGVPTMNRLLSDIDECKATTKKVDDTLQKTKDDVTEKVEKEIKEREESYQRLHKDQTRQDKRIKALKERMKSSKRGKTAKASGAPEDEFLEDEEEGNE